MRKGQESILERAHGNKCSDSLLELLHREDLSIKTLRSIYNLFCFHREEYVDYNIYEFIMSKSEMFNYGFLWAIGASQHSLGEICNAIEFCLSNYGKEKRSGILFLWLNGLEEMFISFDDAERIYMDICSCKEGPI